MLPLTYGHQLRQAALNYQQAMGASCSNSSTASIYSPYRFDPVYFLYHHQQRQQQQQQQPQQYRVGYGLPFLEEPKPQHSYIGLIAMAILSSGEQKMILADVYQWILDNYLYFRARGPGWRNSIRHNLSLNDCFIKTGRSANGKGHYWAIHPANIDDFKKGDFRRRRAQRKVRRHMGLSLGGENEDSDDSTDLASRSTNMHNDTKTLMNDSGDILATVSGCTVAVPKSYSGSDFQCEQQSPASSSSASPSTIKRIRFDIDSLLAPERKFNETLSEKLLKKPGNSSDSTGNGPTLDNYPLEFAWSRLNFPLELRTTLNFPPELNSNISSENDCRQDDSSSPNTAQQWRDCFAKIMARTYQRPQIRNNYKDRSEK